MSDGRIWRLARAVARHGRMADLLPELHQQAIHVTGAKSSVLLRLNPRTDLLQPSSAVGLDTLDPEPWLTEGNGREIVGRMWKDGGPIVTADLPELNRRLGAHSAMLVPLLGRRGPLGMLALGLSDAPAINGSRVEIAAVGDLVALALERERLQRDADLQHDLRQLVTEVAKAVASPIHLNASLEIFCDRACRLFTADRVSIWLHDRRARAIDLVASSDGAQMANRQRLSADEPSTIANGMRAAAPLIEPSVESPGAANVMVSLRGRRRALGTLHLEGVRVDPGDDAEVIDRLEEVGRQLSAAIENLWLLEDVLRSRRELENTFDSLSDLVVVIDRRLMVSHVNQAFGRRLARKTSEILERPLSSLFGPDVIAWVEQTSALPVEDGSQAFETKEIPDPLLGGTFIFTVSQLVGRHDEPIGTVIVARDVTDQSRLEAERVELRDRLTQSEKLAALGQFVAGIAHELNNPLQGVLGHVELMLHEPLQLPTRVRKDLKLVLREADRAAKIVHNLLVFAGSRKITRRRLNLSLVVTRALALRSTACAAAAIEVVKNLDLKTARVSGDALLLQQALLNILLNAEQALATISGPRRIEVSTRRKRVGRLELQVADNGPGIPVEALPRLFEPFYTTKEVGQGTGLGLAIAYGIVQEHGGDLKVANRPHGGAVFTIELPSGADGVE